MTKKQIIRFIKKVAGKTGYCSIFYYYNKKESSYFARADVIKRKIEINRYFLKAFKEETIRAMLMHEIGHLKTRPLLGLKPHSWVEYEAQMWAISRARELGFKRIERRLLRVFSEWKEYENNKKFRCYYLAFKMAERNGVI